MDEDDDITTSIKKNVESASEEFDVINYTRDLFYRGNPTRDVERKIQSIKSRLFIKIITGEDFPR